MANSRRAFRGARVLAGVVLIGGAVAAGVAYFRYSHRDELPVLAVPDIQEGSRQAAQVERIRGQVYMRPALPSDEVQVAPFPAGWSPVQSGSSLTLGTLLHAGPQSAVELSSSGHWYMGFDGDGAMILQDARKNSEGTEHTMSVYIQQGTFRAKSASDSYKGYFLEITTAAAKLHVSEGEIGVQVGPSGKGRMWLVSGKAVAVWNDGRRKELGLRGLEDL